MNLINIRIVAYGLTELEDLRNQPGNSGQDEGETLTQEEIEAIAKAVLAKLQLRNEH